VIHIINWDKYQSEYHQKRNKQADKWKNKSKKSVRVTESVSEMSVTNDVIEGEGEGEVEEKSKSLVPSAHKKRSTLPLDFQLTPDLRAFAIDQGVQDPHTEFSAFRDYHQARGSVFRDWPAAWRTWARNYSKFRRNANEQNTRKSFDAIRTEKNEIALKRANENIELRNREASGSIPERTEPDKH
jgi:hypothetical protein